MAVIGPDMTGWNDGFKEGQYARATLCKPSGFGLSPVIQETDPLPVDMLDHVRFLMGRSNED